MLNLPLPLRTSGKHLALIASILMAVMIARGASADTAVWKASSGSSHLYLAGTVHLLRPSDYPLPEEFNQAYADSNRLFFETDIGSMNDLATQASMLQQLTYSDGRTLQSVLNQEAYTALSDYLATLGLPIQMLQSFKPGLVVSTLEVFEFQKMGFTPQGVDMHFYNRALGDGKPTGELEPIQAQIDYIANMGVGNESDFILLSLQDMSEIENQMEQLIAAWRNGRNEELADLFVNDMKEQSLELYNSLLVERNNNWMKVIEAMFTQDGTEFILVGAAHLVGDDGLLKQLAAKGYTVEQL